MPFWKKAFQKQQGVYYPQAVVQGKPVETETIAKDLAKQLVNRLMKSLVIQTYK